MDRDKRWERVAKAYNAIVEAEGQHFADPQAAISDAYAHKLFDEFVPPAVIGDYWGVKDGDGVLCFNFRADRVREILAAMLDPNFAGFPRKRIVRFAAAAGMTEYSDELNKLMSPVCFARSTGIPLPVRRKRRPDWVPAGTLTRALLPSIAGTSNSPPSAAVTIDTGTRQCRSAPSR